MKPVFLTKIYHHLIEMCAYWRNEIVGCYKTELEFGNKIAKRTSVMFVPFDPANQEWV
jgi:hypothetical protein